MEYRYLGRSGLKVSTLSLGTMTFGGKDRFSKLGNNRVKEASKIIEMCIDNGINLIDTANIYSYGEAEKIVGEVLKGKRPGDVLISTKARMPIGDGPNDSGVSRYHIIRECERSLERLQTDVIDIYYIHEWDGRTPMEEMLEALSHLVQQGKVRYIGCSNFSGWHIMKALNISREKNLSRFITQQIHYTLEAREAEYELLPIAVDQGVGVHVWSPLAGGLLTGKYTRDKKPEGVTRMSEGWTEPPIRDEERLWNIVDAINENAPDAEIVAKSSAINPVEGIAKTETFLQAHPNMKVIAAIGGGGAVGANEAGKAAGKLTEDFGVFAADATDQELEAMVNNEANRMSVLITGDAEKMSEVIYGYVQKLLNDEEVPQNVYRELIPVTQENVEQYYDGQ